jgi:hypothetical protein
MKRKLASLSSSLNRARAAAANYRLVGKPGNAGALPMTRYSSPGVPFWSPTLLDSLRAPLTRHRE